MTERDPFERELGRLMNPRPAPAELQRRIARIPLEHPRPRGERPARSWWRWFSAGSAPWAVSLTAAFASLAIGFWLGFSDLADTADGTDSVYASNDEQLASLVFPSVPTTIGEEQ
ncbi:MAG TPA: hypothetical protein VGQ35_02020 [Dongiaceae bacterium]|nr:hypothetical protein [Dongiaceae bacterium]